MSSLGDSSQFVRTSRFLWQQSGHWPAAAPGRDESAADRTAAESASSSIRTPCGRSRPAALEQRNQDFCFANASRASLSCFQFGAYLSASSYFASASFMLPCFTSTSPQAFKGSAQCGPRLLASISFASAPTRSPCLASATPQE